MKNKCSLCRKNGTAYIRGIMMCDLHFSIYKRDNQYRFSNDLHNDDLKIYKNCKTYVCKNKILSEAKDNIEKYCKDCKINNLIQL